MGDLTGIDVTDAIDVSGMEHFAVTVGGTFVGTYSVEVSQDGTTFVAHPDATDKTAPFVLAVSDNPYKEVRVNCTAHTSGTLKNLLGGRDEDRAG